MWSKYYRVFFFFFQAEDGIRDVAVTGVQTCALPIFTEQQVAELEKTRKASDTLTLLSPFRGVVQSVPVEQGKSVKMGDMLVEVADLGEIGRASCRERV